MDSATSTLISPRDEDARADVRPIAETEDPTLASSCLPLARRPITDADNQPRRQRSTGRREAVTARRDSRERTGGGVMGKGRGLALAAVLAVMVSGGLAAQAD